MKNQFKTLFEHALFDVEHAILMYANSYATMPAQFIYNKKCLSPYMSVIKKCHIYMIGFQPKIEFVKAEQSSNIVRLTFSILGGEYTIERKLPSGMEVCQDDEIYLIDKKGVKCYFDPCDLQSQLSYESRVVNFDVKYIGQAFGNNGSRHAVNRLLKHETLQKISIKGVPDGYQITLLLLEVQPYNSQAMMFNPFAKNRNEGLSRIKSGIDKLYDTTEQERIALYEAAFIRYFSPQFNKEFKDSFPSTNLKILRDCYEKDFSAIVAEICIDELPFELFSESVTSSTSHMAKFNLHDDASRKVFFSKD